jgi:hypothetical protein
VPVGPGGLSARNPRTFRLGPVDFPPGPRGLSAGRRGPSTRSTRAAHVLSSFKENNDPRTVRLEANFLENLCQKTQILYKSQKPADRPPQVPGLSAQHLKTDFSKDFQRSPFTKRNRHPSKCNACKFLIKVALWKVKPIKLTPLDSMAIYPKPGHKLLYTPMTGEMKFLLDIPFPCAFHSIFSNIH